MPNKYPNLKSLMALNGLNGSQLAEHLAISKSAFSLRINCKRDFTMLEIEKLIKLFGHPYEHIFFSPKLHD